MKQTLHKGDIIIFKAENDWLSKAIAWFTKSDASHAAMAYSEDSIVEVGANGIGVHKVDISDGQDIYVMELASKPDSAPLIESANHYLNAKVRYDFPALFILAGLLIYRRITPTKRLFHIANQILSSSALMLDKMIQHAILHHTDQAMVCSQLVYQIFYDCGGDYRIQIVTDSIKNSPFSEDSIRLYDLLSTAKHSSPSFQEERSCNEKISSTTTPHCLTQDEMDTLAKELYTALCETEQQPCEILPYSSESKNSDVTSTLSSAKHFLSKLEHFFKVINCDMPLDAMFVTPGDLVYHAANLKQVGTLSLKRIQNR